jgi:carbonic anhydrase/SulP family sulfate permease
MRRPIRRIVERHASGDVLRIELANQVSYLSKAALEKILREAPRGAHVLLDARNTDYIDPDVLDFIEDFRSTISIAHGVNLSMVGFRVMYPQFEDNIQYVDHTTRELQHSLSPNDVLAILKEGNERFQSGRRITRDFGRQVDATAAGQYPMAVVLSCIDSRTPSEFVFDLGLGDIFSVRVAGNVAKDKVLGSIEYACRCAGAKLVVVMGHSSCGAVKAAVDLFGSDTPISEATGCENLATLIGEIQSSIEVPPSESPLQWGTARKTAFTDGVSRKNVSHTLAVLRERSATLRDMERQGQIAIVGAFYDVSTGQVSFIDTVALPHSDPPKLRVVNL